MPGFRGQMVVSHPLGRQWQTELHQRHPDNVPHPLPTLEKWNTMIADLPLSVKSYRDDPDFYITVLQVSSHSDHRFQALYMQRFQRITVSKASPCFLKGKSFWEEGLEVQSSESPRQIFVQTAFGIFSKIGPKASISGDSFGAALNQQLANEVVLFFRWAKIVDDLSDKIYPAVLNLGSCPTMKGQKNEEISLEAHLMHSFEEDFYGKTLKIAIVGFLRPELRFSGVEELISQIQTDIGKARNALKESDLLTVQQNDFFL